MRPWKSLLDEKKLLIADGAWGTQLAERGLPVGTAPEAWNVERPDHVRGVAEDYVAAGADIILTNTFGANRVKLARFGLQDRAEELNRVGAELSRAAAGEGALVFASVGPTGEFMAPLGTATEEDIVACFAEQARALAAGGADGIVIETMTDLGETLAAVRAARESCSLPVVACLTYDKGARGFATMMGVRPENAAAELEQAGADVIGTNCGNGIEDMVEVVRLLRGATDKPIWAKPNAGRPELVDGRTVYGETPEQMAARLPALVAAGAAVVGGCCGTTPAHVAALRAAAAQLASP